MWSSQNESDNEEQKGPLIERFDLTPDSHNMQGEMSDLERGSDDLLTPKGLNCSELLTPKQKNGSDFLTLPVIGGGGLASDVGGGGLGDNGMQPSSSGSTSASKTKNQSSASQTRSNPGSSKKDRIQDYSLQQDTNLGIRRNTAHMGSKQKYEGYDSPESDRLIQRFESSPGLWDMSELSNLQASGGVPHGIVLQSNGTYKRLGCFILLLISHYILCRIAYPVKECAGKTLETVLFDIRSITFLSLLVCYLVGLDRKERFEYIFKFSKKKPRAMVFLVFFFATGILPYLVQFLNDWIFEPLTNSFLFGFILHPIFGSMFGIPFTIESFPIVFAYISIFWHVMKVRGHILKNFRGDKTGLMEQYKLEWIQNQSQNGKSSANPDKNGKSTANPEPKSSTSLLLSGWSIVQKRKMFGYIAWKGILIISLMIDVKRLKWTLQGQEPPAGDMGTAVDNNHVVNDGTYETSSTVGTSGTVDSSGASGANAGTSEYETARDILSVEERLGLILALFSEFNHPFSVVTLALGTGLYTRGLACSQGIPGNGLM